MFKFSTRASQNFLCQYLVTSSIFTCCVKLQWGFVAQENLKPSIFLLSQFLVGNESKIFCWFKWDKKVQQKRIYVDGTHGS